MPKYIATRWLMVKQTLELECASEEQAKSMAQHPTNSIRWTDLDVTDIGRGVDIKKKEEVQA